MSISVTTINGTDSISGSRIVINNNFKLLAEEVNSIENFLNPSNGVLSGLNSTTTAALTVGTVQSPILQITASTFNILKNVTLTKNITLNGGSLFRNNFDPQLINDAFVGVSLTTNIGTSSAIPAYGGYRVGNSSTSPITLNVYDGAIGQELFFVYSESTTGSVVLQGGDTQFALDVISTSGAGTTITLNQKGQSVHLLAVNDGSGNPVWYIVGGNGYSVA